MSADCEGAIRAIHAAVQTHKSKVNDMLMKKVTTV